MTQKLPKGWEIRTLGEVTDIFKGGTPKRSVERYFQGDLAWATPTDITKLNGALYIDDTETHISEEALGKSAARLLPPGTVLLTSRATIGKVAISRIPIATNQGFANFLCKEEINNLFLAYYLKSRRNLLISLGTGTTFLEVTKATLLDVEIPLPPLPTQRKIAAVLSTYDDLIENNTRRINILEDMAQTLYQEWFVHFRFLGHENVAMVESPLGPIPEGWEVKQLGEMCDVLMGQSPKSEFYNETGEGLPFHQGVTDFGQRFPTDRVYCTVQKRIAEAGDILFSVRAPVGRINVANKKIVIGRGLSAIRSKSGDQAFVLQQLKDKFQEEDTIGSGTIYNAITKVDLLGVQLLEPIGSIVAKFEEAAEPISLELANLTMKNTNLRQTRDLLLPKLISGEIDVSELDIDTNGMQPVKSGTHIPYPLTERLHTDEKILGGKPVIKGTRLAVAFILDLLKQGWSEEEIVENYPSVAHEDIEACRAYEKKVTRASVGR